MNITELTRFFDHCVIEKFDNDSQWHKQREKGIGGSEAGIIVNVNKYQTPHDLWEVKTGRTIAEDISDKPAIIKGNLMEPIIYEIFKIYYGNMFEVVDTKNFSLMNSKDPWMRANLDGALINLETHEKGILEIKTTTIQNANMFENWNDDHIPDSYYCQCLHYLNVTGFDFVVLYCFADIPWANEQKSYYRVIRKQDVEDDLDYLRQAEEIFWKEHVLKDKEPPFLGSIL